MAENEAAGDAQHLMKVSGICKHFGFVQALKERQLRGRAERDRGAHRRQRGRQVDPDQDVDRGPSGRLGRAVLEGQAARRATPCTTPVTWAS